MALLQFVKQSLYLLPLKTTIVKGGATARPPLRSKLTARFLSAVAARCKDLPFQLDTNLGIDQKLRIRLSSSKSDLLFGSPKLFIGERASLDLALALSKHCDCFLDVGANIGLYIFYLRCKGLGSKPIYFFEPDPHLFSSLTSNLERNNIENVHGFSLAMAETTGRRTFFRNRTDDLSGTLVQEDWLEATLEPLEIGTTSFSDFARDHGLRNVCAKVDVEGAEDLFFEGASSSLDRLRCLIIEILGPAHERKLPARIITEAGFQAYYINDYRLEYSSSGRFNYVSPFYNWLFCREGPALLRKKLKGTKFKIIDAPGSIDVQ
jgi:FkbM family methyltransferase